MPIGREMSTLQVLRISFETKHCSLEPHRHNRCPNSRLNVTGGAGTGTFRRVYRTGDYLPEKKTGW
jgi:hypothetical protein